MSKKLYTEVKWKRRSHRRQVDELAKVQRRKMLRDPASIDARLTASGRRRRKKDHRPFSEIAAPAIFSIVENPEGMSHFLHTIEIVSRTHHISLDLSGVVSLTTDAVAALVATIRKPDMQTTVIRGNQPNAPKPREQMIESGFFSHVRSEQPITGVKGRISERQSKKVEPKIARDLIHLATNALLGAPKKSQAAYRALIECMNNTHNHAAGGGDYKETWWATSYADILRSRACYTFLDTGVGIFRSVKIGKLRKLLRLAGISTDADVLRNILHGKVESSTGMPFRGKGLPSIYNLCKSGAIESLIIVANDVYARVERDEYRQMNTPFKGTLLYWEIAI